VLAVRDAIPGLPAVCISAKAEGPGILNTLFCYRLHIDEEVLKEADLWVWDLSQEVLVGKAM